MKRLAKKTLRLLAKIRFSVRGLLAIVLVVSLVLGGLVVPYLGYRRQIDGLKPYNANLTIQPCWQARLIGDTRTGPIIAASFQTIDDAGLVLVSRLADLEELEIEEFHNCIRIKEIFKPTNAGLAHLKSLGKLRRLSLDPDWLTVEGFRHVGKLVHLEELALTQSVYHEGRARPTGDGLASLKSLSQLRKISLSPYWATDEVINEVGQLVQLEQLEITIPLPCEECSKPTTASLAPLKSLKNLRQLGIYGTGLTDDGLDDVRKLISLEDLTVRNSNITDEGLHRLAGLDRLRSLTLDLTPLEGGGLDYLQELPGLRILTLSSNGSLDDKALAHLAGATQIRKLVLDGVDEQGLALLKGFTHLETLEIEPINADAVTRNQLHNLESSLGKTKVIYHEPPVYSSGFR